MDEPRIVVTGGVIRGIAGRPVPIPGANFGDPASDEPPTVYFGDVPGTDVVVAPGGVRVTVTPPPGEEGSTVPLTVVRAVQAPSKQAPPPHAVPSTAPSHLPVMRVPLRESDPEQLSEPSVHVQVSEPCMDCPSAETSSVAFTVTVPSSSGKLPFIWI